MGYFALPFRWLRMFVLYDFIFLIKLNISIKGDILLFVS